MKINIYKNQNEIEKTLECNAYDLMYGTVEDILQILDGITDKSDQMQLFNAVAKNRAKLNNLLKDIFPELTDEDLRNIKVKELIPFFIDLFAFVGESFRNQKK